jgi:hypothetical protein
MNETSTWTALVPLARANFVFRLNAACFLWLFLAIPKLRLTKRGLSPFLRLDNLILWTSN